MSRFLSRVKCNLFSGSALVFAAALMASVNAQAATVVVPFAGTFNETTVAAEDGMAAGDYDTIGGNADVGQFNLLAGNNTFNGSVWTPGDSTDAFLIFIGAGQTLIGASIAFGTNLTPFAPMFAFTAPHWVLEESTATPTIFDLPVGSNGLESVSILTAPAFTRGTGFYSVLLGNGTFGINSGNFKTPISYTMTFSVEEKIRSTPIPAALPLLAGGLGLLGFASRRRKRQQAE